MPNADDSRPDRGRTPSVFISGSISIRSPLSSPVMERLDTILDRGMRVLIGDAPGVDAAVQTYLDMRSARDVTIFCGGTTPRHNVGGWPVRTIGADARPGTREWHMAKDREMTRLADIGFVIWDGVSRGSVANIDRLAKRGCYVLVYLHREDRFVSLRSNVDLDAFLDADASSTCHRIP